MDTQGIISDDEREKADGIPHDEQMEPDDSHLIMSDTKPSCRSKFGRLTVEPVLFLVFISYSLSDSILQNLILSRTCEVELQFNHSICKLLSNNSEEGERIEALVQPHASVLVMAKNFMASLLPAIMSLFLGHWSDNNGRRVVLIFPLLGAFITSIFYTVFALVPKMHPVYILVASLPLALSGGIINCVIGSYCYISDITSDESRTLRMSVLDGSIFLGMMIGSSSCSYIFAAGGRYGYILICFLTTVICCFNFVYAYLFVPETIRPNEEISGFRNFHITKFLKDMIATSLKKRPNSKRAVIFLTIFAITTAVITMEGEAGVRYLFTRMKFGWNVQQYTIWSTAHVLIIVIGTVIGSVLLGKILKIPDPVLAAMAFLAKTIESIIYVFIPSNASYLMYAASITGSLGGINGPVTRAILSKSIPKDEIGKVFSLTAAFEALVPLASIPLYTLLYNSTMDYLPGAFYLLSASFFLVNTIIFWIVTCIYQYQPEVSYERMETANES